MPGSPQHFLFFAFLSCIAVGAKAQCTYTLNPGSAQVSNAGGTGSFSITASSSTCARPAASNASWLTVTFGQTGSGNGSVGYRVDPNPTYVSRTGVISVVSTPFTVTQDALPCPTATFSPSAQAVQPAGGSFGISITSPCGWSATSQSSWITLGSNSGTGSSTLTYSVSAFTSGTTRTGTILINGIPFSVIQTGTNCTYSVTSGSTSFAVAGGQGSVSVQTTSICPWTVANPAAWITGLAINGTAGLSATGNGTLSFTVAPNNNGPVRSATLTLAGQTVTISQAGIQCAITLNPASAHVNSSANTGTFAVTDGTPNCPWTATSNNSWISITSGQIGSANGTVSYSVSQSTSYQTQTGTISVNTTPFTITQDAYPCTYAFSPLSGSAPQAGGNLTASVATSCLWTASTSTPWISLNAGSGTTGNGSLSYTIAPNSAVAPRSGSIQINDQSYMVTQMGTNCTYSVSPPSISLTAGGGQSQLVVQTNSGCPWNVQSAPSWIGTFTINGAAGTTGAGGGTLGFTVSTNPGQSSRSATFTVANQPVTVTQSGVGVLFTSQSVVNGASFLSGPVAPGELFTIFGTGLGPAQAVGLQTTPDGRYVTNSLSGTRVLFDGMAVPLTYVSATQVNAIVPFALTGAVSTQLTVEVQGIASPPVTMAVAPSSPAIFAAAGGTGQGAVLNQDNSANSASNPATVGSVLQVYATGFGQTAPTGVDGLIAGANPSNPLATVTATVGGMDAVVQYAGSSNGLVAGVTQVNVQIPQGVTPGPSVPLVIRVGGQASAPGITVAVQ